MTDVQFGRLTDLPLRNAWRHEAHQFTPWLAENIDHLSEAIGIPLELTGTEVAVERYSADILARDRDDNVVLIENQLETTDHTHLGQIMTYLAGLDAQSVIWIAPAFREPHLSAIRWLNEHTADGFSFFVVKARVVRIGDSPFAPIFEVVERPNSWERKLESAVRGNLHTLRREYWNNFCVPGLSDKLERYYNERYFFLGDGEEFALTLDLSGERAWVYLSYEGERKISKESIRQKIKSMAPGLVFQIPEKFKKSEIILVERDVGLRQGQAHAAKFHEETALAFMSAFSKQIETR